MKSKHPVLTVVLNTGAMFGLVVGLGGSVWLGALVSLPVFLITIAYELQGE